MNALLPKEIALNATLCGNEYGWALPVFPAALDAAERLSFACLGGQVQFRIKDSIFEAYWLNADSSDRLREEEWKQYVQRSCKEVSAAFASVIEGMDAQRIVDEWPSLKSSVHSGVDPRSVLVFVAYFVTEAEHRAV